MIWQLCHYGFLLAAAHAVADWPLQPGDMGNAKRPGGNARIHWTFALGCHSLIHGGAVALVTGQWWIGALETVAHAMIDGAKCRLGFSNAMDQVLHFACKPVWAVLAVWVTL
jgi:hypothetical protein